MLHVVYALGAAITLLDIEEIDVQETHDVSWRAPAKVVD